MSVNAGGVLLVVGYFIVSIAFMRLRKTEPELERPYRITIGVMAIGLSILPFYF
ncbi:hypothetical protein [Bacillus sp. NPDC077027]|uniref:hypothetical protein n=1 Tax=Bacillus sp. NPDC077027 TaxID=3390548 RepID=UPI003D059DD3